MQMHRKEKCKTYKKTHLDKMKKRRHMVGDTAGDMAGKVLLKKGAPWQKKYTLMQLQPMEDTWQSRDNTERPAPH